MKAIFGDFEFGHFLIRGDQHPVAIVHRVTFVADVQDEDEADNMMDEGRNSYIIPGISKEEVLFANPTAAASWVQAINGA